MPPRRAAGPYHPSSQHEREFLRIVTRGYPDLERQAESCEIAEYDATGWCYVHVLEGPPSPIRMADGPTLIDAQHDGITVCVDTILWMTETGMLYTIEVVAYGEDIPEPYHLFTEAAQFEPSRLRYAQNGNGDGES